MAFIGAKLVDTSDSSFSLKRVRQPTGGRARNGRTRRQATHRHASGKSADEAPCEPSEESSECPLCLEELDAAEKAFFPCACGYQVCLWCLSRLRTACEEGQVPRCPACRTPYDESRFQLREELSDERLAEKERLREINRRKKERQLRQEQLERERQEQREYELAKRIRTMRQTFIVQRNLICIRGLHQSLWSEHTIRRSDMFGKTGRIQRVLFVQGTGVYVEYADEVAATRAIQLYDGARWQGHEVHVSYGTVRYCEAFVQACEQYLKTFVEWKQSQIESAQWTSGRNPSIRPLDASDTVAVAFAGAKVISRKRAPNGAKPPQPPTQKRCVDPACLYRHEFASNTDAISREAFLQSRYGPPPPLHAFRSATCTQTKKPCSNATLQPLSDIDGRQDAGSISGAEAGPNEDDVVFDEFASPKISAARENDLFKLGCIWGSSSPLSWHAEPGLGTRAASERSTRLVGDAAEGAPPQASGAMVNAWRSFDEYERISLSERDATGNRTALHPEVEPLTQQAFISWDPAIQMASGAIRRSCSVSLGAVGERRKPATGNPCLPDNSPISHSVSSGRSVSIADPHWSVTEDPYTQLTKAFAQIGVTNVRIENSYHVGDTGAPLWTEETRGGSIWKSPRWRSSSVSASLTALQDLGWRPLDANTNLADS
jgi:hypothetical protein